MILVLGKFFSKAEDSLVSEVNRASSGTLPQEYYTGKYTILTDMFYLAELFGRLIDNALFCDRKDFSYNDILSKMMENSPENRYENFVAVREAMGKRDFLSMEVSDEDRETYQEFTNSIYQSLSSYMGSPTFVTDCSIFISRLEEALKTNLFESIIQQNANIIRSVVNCGYYYNNNVNIPTDVVRKFLDWFKGSTAQSQNLILNNFIAKISNIKIEDPEEDLPF